MSIVYTVCCWVRVGWLGMGSGLAGRVGHIANEGADEGYEDGFADEDFHVCQYTPNCC